MVARHFGRLAPVGLLSNVLVIPLCACLLATGFALLLLADLPGVASVAVLTCKGASAAFWWVAETAASSAGGQSAVSWQSSAQYQALPTDTMHRPSAPQPASSAGTAQSSSVWHSR